MHERRIVSYITARLQNPAHEPFLLPEVRVNIDNLGVLAAWRRRGVGRQLMAAVEHWALQHGARRIMLSAWEFNQGALGSMAPLATRHSAGTCGRHFRRRRRQRPWRRIATGASNTG